MTDFNTKNPFKVPELYFDRLEEQILDNSEPRKNKVHFKIPRGYFDQLENDIAAKTKVQSNKSKIQRIVLSVVGIAASFILLFSISYLRPRKTLIEEQAFDEYVEEYYSEDLDGYEILSLLEEIENENPSNELNFNQ
ncbi:MAG: hypothetical protein VW080_08030 [Flavobacteriaceae bacterium]